MVAPWRDPRTGIYKLRRRVPTRFRGVAGVQGGLIKLSTGTADSSEMKRRWPGTLQRYAALEAEWERRLNLVSVTPDLAAGLAANWTNSCPILDPTLVAEGLFAIPGLGDQNEDHAQRQHEQLVVHAEQAARLAGISVDPATLPILLRAVFPAVSTAYVRAGLAGDKRMLRVLDALTSETPSSHATEPAQASKATRAAEPAQGAVSLSGLFIAPNETGFGALCVAWPSCLFLTIFGR